MSFKLNEHTGVLIKKAARLFERVANMNLSELGITHSQTTFLVRLWERDGQTQMELTKSSGLKQPTVVRLLDRMERDDLIKRVHNKEDRRSYNFFLTERAKLICKELEGQGKMMQAIAQGKLKVNAINTINDLLSVIIENLSSFLEVNER
jgi:DNA-binding MarR family transcriptional regulator